MPVSKPSKNNIPAKTKPSDVALSNESGIDCVASMFTPKAVFLKVPLNPVTRHIKDFLHLLSGYYLQ